MTSHGSRQAISPLRRRMIEDMTVRNFVEKTRKDYIRHVKTLAAFLGRSPDTAEPEDLRRFQLHQRQTGVQPPTMNAAVSALRFFFTVTLDRPDVVRHLTGVRQPRKLPVVLTPDEVARLLDCAPGPGLKYQAAFSVAYGAGLRAAEVVALKVSDIDSARGILRVEQSLPRRRPGAKAARIATQCCRPSCSRSSETGGGRPSPGAGCFPDGTRQTL